MIDSNCRLYSVILLGVLCSCLCGCENGPRIRRIPGLPDVFVEYFPEGTAFGVFGASTTTTVRDDNGKLISLRFESSSRDDFVIKRPVYLVELRSADLNRQQMRSLVDQFDRWSNDGAVLVVSFSYSESSAYRICAELGNVKGIVGIHMQRPILDERLANLLQAMNDLERIAITFEGSTEESILVERLEKHGILITSSTSILVNQSKNSE